jgi:hypothetical protein
MYTCAVGLLRSFESSELSAALHLLDENLPAGVSWSSDSGAFYRQPLCPGDFASDGNVDGPDLDLFAAGFGRSDCDQGEACAGDLNGDNDSDGSDLVNFLADFGRTDCSHCYMVSIPLADSKNTDDKATASAPKIIGIFEE